MILQLLLLVVGFAMLVKGADWFVDGAAGIADRFGIPQLVIGLTVVAMGTSSPEAAVSITAALKGNADITIGNVVGSNILNILIILGITSTIVSIAVAKSTIRYEIPYMIGITILLLVQGYTGGKVTLFEGIVLWIAFLAYLVYLIYMAKQNIVNAESVEKQKPIWLLIVLVLVGLGVIIWGSDIAVDAATVIAKKAGLSERFIGLTIVALGTSMPELVTSVTAATRGKVDLAVGNIVGSNIFNILFVVGTTALITPVAFADNFIIDMVVAIVSAILLLAFVVRKKKLTRSGGICMLVLYAAYFVYLIQ